MSWLVAGRNYSNLHQHCNKRIEKYEIVLTFLVPPYRFVPPHFPCLVDVHSAVALASVTGLSKMAHCAGLLAPGSLLVLHTKHAQLDARAHEAP